ncbi:MAG: hypothetical protein K1X82_09085, partial [Bacteroidia bacterium]|nr:hypothetical protein [Bacteroidia bacterium]
MKKQLYLLLGIFILSFSTIQVGYSQCSCSASDFATISVAGWTVGQSGTITTCQYGGERSTITGTVAGATYRVSTCGSSYDTQLSIYTTGCTYLAYNDDNGPACSGLQASVDFTSPGGSIYSVMNLYSCTTNSTCATVTVTLISSPVATNECPNGSNLGINNFGCNVENIINPINQGDYARFNVISGVGYNFNTSGTSYDSKIWGKIGGVGGATLFYQNSNNIAGNNESIDWVSNYSGTIGVAVGNTNCAVWNGTSAILRYKQLTTVTNTTSTAAICTGTSKPLTYSLSGNNNNPNPVWSIVSGGGTITSNDYNAGSYTGSVTVRATLGVCTSDVTFNVTPNNTITLTSGVNSNLQTRCVNTPISNITYSTTGATGANFSNLPPGVNGVYSGGTITISGTPLTTAGSPFTYTVTLTGGCGAITATGTITVTPNNTVTLTSSSGSDNQTACVNSPITQITYSTTGATGASYSGLPTGVNGSFSSNTVTISGSPTITGNNNYTVTLTGGCGTITATGSINVSPVNTINLSSGSTTPTLCINTPLTTIVYSTTGATGATFSGLPSGVTGNFSGNSVIISGTPTVSGSFPYTVTLTGGCGTVTSSGTITVSPNNTATLTSAAGTTNQTVCANSPITNIVYSTTGATGVSFTGLPGGVSGNFAGNIITISGSPTIQGNYTYVGTLTGGCGTTTITGNISVTPSNTITLSSAPSTTSQSLCINNPIANITYNTTGATGASVTGLPTGVNGVFASNTVTISGIPSVSGTFPYTVTLSGGCGNLTSTGTITVLPNHSLTLSSATGTDNQNVCVNSPITSVIYSIGGGASVAFISGGALPAGVTGNLSGSNFIISGTPTATGTYTVNIGTFGNACVVASATVTIVVNPYPVVSITNNDPSICSGSNTDISLTSNIGGTLWSWSTVNTGTTSGQSNQTNVSATSIAQTISGSGTVTYSVTGSSNGCSSTAGSTTVTVTPLPNGQLNGTTTICEGGSTNITFVATSGTGPFDIVYDPGSVSLNGINSGHTFSVSPVGTTSYTLVSITDASTCVRTTAFAGAATVSVNPKPQGNLTGAATICNGDITNLVFNATSGTGPFNIVYTNGSSNFNLTGLSDGSTISVSPSTTTSFSIVSITDAFCTNNAVTNTPVTVTVNPLPQGVISGTQAICSGQSANLTVTFTSGTGPFDITYSDGTSTFNLTGVTNGHTIPVNPLSNTTYTLTAITDANSCSRTTGLTNGGATITVNPLPSLTIIGLDAGYCISSPTDAISGFPAGGAFSGVGISGSNFEPITAGVGGPYPITYTYTDGNGCTNSISQNTSVFDLPVVSFTGLAGPYCASQTSPVALIGSPLGGTFSGNGISGTDFIPANATVGVNTITYSYTDANSCSNSITQNATIIGIQVVSFSGLASSYCQDNSTPTTLVGNPSGGVFSGNGISSNDFTASVAGVGSHPITYSYVDGNGCQSTSTQTAIVNALPTVDVTAADEAFCIDAGSILFSGFPTGGNYSSSPIAGALTGNLFDPIVGGVGNHTITYVYTDGNGCSNSNSFVVTINDLPNVTFTIGSDYCENSGAVSLSGNPTGGTFSGIGVSGSSFFPNIAGIGGPYTITYSYTDGNGCSNSNAQQTNVSAAPVVTLSPLSSTCSDALPFALSGGSPVGGTYSGTGVVANTFDPSIAGVGTHTITYSFTSPGCAPVTATTTIVVNSAPTASISYSEPFCTSVTTTQNPTLTGATGGTYSSTAGLSLDINTGAILPSSSTAGSYTVTYSVPASNGCSSVSATATVNITDQPTASIVYTGSPFCTNGSVGSVTLTGTSGGTYSSTTGLTIDANTGDIDPSTSTAGTYIVTYTIAAGAGCSGISTTTSVTITNSLSANISYSEPFCTSVTTAQNPTLTGATGGTYSSTAGLSLDINTGAILPSSSTAGSYTVTYSVPASNGCSSVTATATVNITDQPTASIVYTGSPFCTNGSVGSVTLTGTSGGTYSSTAGLTIDANTGDIDPSTSTAGTYIVTYTIAASAGCSGISTTTSVTITNSLSANISYSEPFCTSVTTAQNPTLTGATGGTYSSTAGLSLDINTGAILPSSSTAGSYTITYSVPASNGCSSVTATATVNITDQPTASIVYTGSPFCTNGSVGSVTLTGTSGGTYSSTAGLTIDANTGDIDPSTSTAGTYIVTYTIAASAGCSGISTTTSVTITNSLSANISYSEPFCTSVTTAQNPTLTGATGGTYSSTAGLSLDINTGAILPSTSTAGSYTVTYSVPASNGCSSVSATATVNITDQPTASIVYSGSPFCTNGSVGSVALTGTSGGTYSSSAGLTINATTGDITPSTSTPGTYTVTYTIPASNGCGAVTATASVTVNAAPTASISYSTPFCTGTSVSQNPTLTGASGGTYSSTAGLSLDVNTGGIVPSTSTAGTYSITYTVPASGGCSSITANTSVTITAQPTASIVYSGSPFCTNGSVGSVTITGTTGGAFSPVSDLTIDLNSGDIDPSTSVPGTYTITYTVPASNGCGAVVANTSVTINSAPIAGISYLDPFCTGTTSSQLPSLTGTTGGTYSSTAGLSLDANTGAILPSASTPATYTVTYSVPASNGCSSITATASVTINQSPTASIAYPSALCTNGGTASVTFNGTPGGTYSSTAGLTIDANTGDIEPSTSTPGTYTVTYTIPASNGCGAVTATASVTVNAAPTASISYSTPFCTGTSVSQNPTLSGASGGTYSSTAGLSLDANTGGI